MVSIASGGEARRGAREEVRPAKPCLYFNVEENIAVATYVK